MNADGFQSRTVSIKINDLKANEWTQFINVTLYRNKFEKNQVLWSNASQLDSNRGQESDSSPERSSVKLETQPQTSSSETATNTDDLLVKQPRGYLVEESKSSSELTKDCTIYTVVLFLLTVLCLK